MIAPRRTPDLVRQRLRVRGLVQGVGFRPFVHALARRHGLTGFVLNDAAGVLIEVQGRDLSGFRRALTVEAPPLARIRAVEPRDLAPEPDEAAFEIRTSLGGAPTAAVTPDAGICTDCLRELFSPQDRRFQHPFLSCTNCGPRHTITHAVPYDRPNTTMATFPLCPACEREYRDPGDRRFHAQPIACPDCGPTLSLPVAAAADLLARGGCLAVKGLGGFQLLCRADETAAVARLRQAKQRDGKPFALLVLNPASAALWAAVSPAEQAALTSPARPVVILRRHTQIDGLARDLAPGLDWLGVMLPATPIQALLLWHLAGCPTALEWRDAPCPIALVATSANRGGEPLAISAADLPPTVMDQTLDHDRAILIRSDDSVVRWSAGRVRPIRRARGFVPEAIELPADGPPTLAVGGHLKTTITLTRGREAFLSQHLGDLDNASTRAFHLDTIRHMAAILAIQPERVVHDRHPDFASTLMAEAFGVPSLAVQHHHAHLAAVAAEHGCTQPVVGLALDGYGYGADGGAWGGELLRLDGLACQRLGHLWALPQPGGDRAAREPWRMAAAALSVLGREVEIAARFADQPLAAPLAAMLATGRVPRTTSCGRWFDAAAGLLGLAETAGYEGEAPMRLESLVRRPQVLPGGWRITPEGVLDLRPLLAALLECDPATGAELFHGTLAAALVDWAAPHAHDVVLLGGGCLMNAVLAEALVAGFAARGLTALLPEAAPANDGGLSLGQAWLGCQAPASLFTPAPER